MPSAWLLPEHVADVLPAEARRIEELRRGLLDAARGYGFELVMPPLLEHVESLLGEGGASADHELDLQTFKLIDQLSGRTLGVRADTTPQVARIDAHLLNRRGVTRLCYCGPLLRTRPSGLHGTREPLQFGAEVYGHAGLEADLEVLELALDALRVAGVDSVSLDLGDARIVRGVLDGVAPDALRRVEVELHAALAAKDPAALRDALRGFPAAAARAALALTRLYGGVDEVLRAARRELPMHPPVAAALNDIEWLARRLRQSHAEVDLGVDLADLGGYGYYSGGCFAAYAPGSSDAVLRGGRYDEVGAAFGRSRPAVGFSLDVKALAALARRRDTAPAIRAPWGEDATLRAAVRRLRDAGETVLCMLPGHAHEGEEFACDRQLVAERGEWVVRTL